LPVSGDGHSFLAVHAVAVVVGPLVEQLEQGVQDGTGRLEHLVDEGEVGLGESAGGDPGVAVLLEPDHGEGAEHLLGHAELREQDGELPAAGPGEQGVQEERFSTAGRADQQRVLLGDQGGQGEVNLFVPLYQGGGQFLAGGLELGLERAFGVVKVQFHGALLMRWGAFGLNGNTPRG
jgi:hypothetical protein